MAITDFIPWKRDKTQVPVKQEEADTFYTLQRNMNHLFNNFFSNTGLSSFDPFDQTLDAFNPRIDMSETATEITISAELPGMTEDDIEVSLSHNMLTVQGEKKAEKEEKQGNFYRTERSYGSFQRSIALPADIVSEQVEASFKQGVLTITLPKTAEAQAQVKRIPVRMK